MTKRNREDLKHEFEDGERPSGADFADLIDSFLGHDDRLEIGDDQTLELPRGLRVGNSSSEVPGTLRFNGDTVEFFDGEGWVDVAGAGGGAFEPVGGGDDVAFAAGNVGIGDFSPGPPIYRLDIPLDANTGAAQQVRFGNAVCSNGAAPDDGYAQFAHRTRSTNTDYALRQGPNGNVHLNAPAGQRISIRQTNNTQPLIRLGITPSGNVVVGADDDVDNRYAFQVIGPAFKTAGGGEWNQLSDLRVKEEVRDLELGLEQLMQVRPVRFRYNGRAGTRKGEEGVGVIGQEIEQVFPEMVHAAAGASPESRGLLIYNGSALTYVLVNAVKQLAGRVCKLEAMLDGDHSAETAQRQVGGRVRSKNRRRSQSNR